MGKKKTRNSSLNQGDGKEGRGRERRTAIIDKKEGKVV